MTLKSKVRDDAELSGKEDQGRWRREVEEAETRGVRLEHKREVNSGRAAGASRGRPCVCHVCKELGLHSVQAVPSTNERNP